MITIIGGGPAGSYLASLLAPKKEVHVFEEHDSIGLPVQCTGITTSYLNNLIRIRKKFLVNKLNKAEIISPNGKAIELKLKETNIVLDRLEFDRYLYEKAQDNGAKYHLNHRLIGLKKGKKIKLKFKGKIKEFQTNKLVGADGPLSVVAKSSGLLKKRVFLNGLQARISMPVDPDIIKFYPMQKSFAWVVPEDHKIARIGVASYRNTNQLFKQFTNKVCPSKYKVREYQAGIIPIYNPGLKSYKKNIYLVGDAATQVKSTTGGGILPGLIASQCLSKAILKKKNYQRLWKREMGKELYLHLLMRRRLDKMSDKKINSLVNVFSQPKLKHILEKYSREHPSKFVLKLLLKEPRLLKFI